MVVSIINKISLRTIETENPKKVKNSLSQLKVYWFVQESVNFLN